MQESRIAILALLASVTATDRGGYTVQEMGGLLEYSAQNVHHHVKILERAGLARIHRTERTQRIPREFWLADVRVIDMVVMEGVSFRIAIGQDRLGPLSTAG